MLTRSALFVIVVCVASLLASPGTIAQTSESLDMTGPHPKVAPAVKAIDAVVEAGPFKADWKSLEGYEIPQWYKDAKFGIFIHWGAMDNRRMWLRPLFFWPVRRRTGLPVWYCPWTAV